MLSYIKFYADGFGRDVISADSPKIKGIEGNRPLQAEEIRRNPATIALVKYLAYVIVGSIEFIGLPCRRSGGSERRPSMIGDGAFFGYIFKFLAPTVRILLFKRSAHTDEKVN